jgi:hypothetical protein
MYERPLLRQRPLVLEGTNERTIEQPAIRRVVRFLSACDLLRNSLALAGALRTDSVPLLRQRPLVLEGTNERTIEQPAIRRVVRFLSACDLLRNSLALVRPPATTMLASPFL